MSFWAQVRRPNWILDSTAVIDRWTGPAHAIYFATYESVKHWMGGNQPGHHPGAAGTSISHLTMRIFPLTHSPAASGACATIASDAFMNPFDGEPDLLNLTAQSDISQSLSKGCRCTAPCIPRSANVRVRSFATRVSGLSTSPTPPLLQ